MGVYTFQNFKDYLFTRLGSNTDFQSPTDYYARWVNSAYRRLTSMPRFWGLKRNYNFPELETSSAKTTADGVAYVSMPTDCLAIREIYDATNKVRLNWMPWSEYVNKTDRADTTAEADPKYWHRYGGNIYLYPTPDDSTTSLTVYYKKRITELTGSGVTDIGAEWDDIILEMATAIGREWANEPEKAERAKKNAVEMIADLVAVYDS